MLATQQVTSTDHYPPTSSAYRLGQYAAQLGEECQPQKAFVFRHEQHEYLRGYRSVASTTKETVAQ